MWVLVLLSGLGPLASDMYISALPVIATELQAQPAIIQLSLTLFLLGMAGGQLLFGPWSDGAGRRVFVIAGPAVFAVLAVVCAVVQDPWVLVAARFAQGWAGAAGLIGARSVISDHFGHDGAARRFALVGSVVSVGPILAPVIGGLILTAASWRVIFLLLGAIGLLTSVGAAARIPETLPSHHRQEGGVAPTLRRFRSLLVDSRFMGLVVTGCLVSAGLFTYISASSFVFQTVYRMSGVQYAILFGSNALGLAVSGLVFARLVGRIKVTRMLLIGLTCTSVAGTILAVGALAGRPPLALVWAALGVLVIGMGFINPATLVLCQRAGAPLSGTAAAVQGGAQGLFGALVSPLTGLIDLRSLTPMALLIFGFMISALLLNRILAVRQRDALAALDRPRPGPGAPSIPAFAPDARSTP